MGTTTYEALPYPEPTDLARNGSVAIRTLAEKVDERFARHYGAGAGPAGATPLPNNVWTTIAAASTAVGTGGAIALAGVTGFTYTGPGSRWFLVAGGANIAVNGSVPNGGLRIIHTSGTVVQLLHSDNYQNLSAGIPVLLASGEGVALQAWANDGSGASGGAYDSAYIRMVAM